MIAQRIVFAAVLELRFQRSALRFGDLAVVYAFLLDESSGLPALHSRRNHRDVIDAAAFHRDVSADILKTLAAEKLANAGNVVLADKAVVIHASRAFAERSSDQA